MNQFIETESLAQQFIKLGLPTTVEILDVACGTGVVAQECKQAGYHQIDGLDPCQGYLDGAMDKGIFRKVYREFIDPDSQTSIPDCRYDVILCCAGFFQGLISPRALPELVRIVRPGGIIAWNLAAGYKDIDKAFARFDEFIMELEKNLTLNTNHILLVREKRWEFAVPVKSHEKMAFTDCGAAYLRGFSTLGGIECEGFTFIMRKL